MPNHVTNVIKINGERTRVQEIFEAIKYDEVGVGSIDFEKLIPMPDSLRIESGSRTDRGLKAYKGFVEVYTLCGTRTDVDLKNIPRDKEEVFLKQRTDIPRDEWKLGRTAFLNEQLYGAKTWYEWCVQNWGTKWNAYGYEEDDKDFISQMAEEQKIYCLTAWSAPRPILKALTQKFPDVEFEHEWADEDIGQNCGRRIYANGEIKSEYYPESDVEGITFAVSVLGYENPSDIGLTLNADESNYIYIEDEDYCMAEINDQHALFTEERLSLSQIPKGLYLYHLRTDGAGNIGTIEHKVGVNFGGSLITAEPLPIEKDSYMAINEDNPLTTTNMMMSFASFMENEFEQSEDFDGGIDYEL